MEKKRPEKKSETLEIRLSHSKKTAFQKACENEGITASQAVRTFIDVYLKRARRMTLQRIAEDISMTLIKNPLKSSITLTSLSGLTIAFFLFGAGVSAAQDENAQPINLPTISYPDELIKQGVTGKCEATFDVAKSGRVEGIVEVDCSHPGFEQTVRASVYTLKFDTTTPEGQRRALKGVVYPFEFAMTFEHDDL